MDKPLKILCDQLKKIITRLKPQQNALSLVIVTGKTRQGKSALLRQSRLEEVFVSNNLPAIYYNNAGIFLEMDETWLNEQELLLQHTLKQINHCYKGVKISGLLFCMDLNSLLKTDTDVVTDSRQEHIHFLTRFGTSLGYPVNTSIMITKMDSLAGFSEFYQSDHISETTKPSGFSLHSTTSKNGKKEHFIQAFNAFVESVDEQVIHKMHPARSTLKRNLIREFPLQLTSLRVPLQSLIQQIPAALFSLDAIYFSSAEQGGVTTDRLNRKIEHEFALAVQDTFPLAINYRPWFIEGALLHIQKQTLQPPLITSRMQKTLIPVTVSLVAITIMLFGYNHYKTTNILDEVHYQLQLYERDVRKNQPVPETLSRLMQARDKLDALPWLHVSSAKVRQLKQQLTHAAQHKLERDFLPALAARLEQVLTHPDTSFVLRYQALKIYLMAADPRYFDSKKIIAWFQENWKGSNVPLTGREQRLLKQAFEHPLANFPIKNQLVTDARNYLNALPTGYLFYTLARETFPKEMQPIAIQGFHVPVENLPWFYTRTGFKEMMRYLTDASRSFQTENWVLARQDLPSLEMLLLQTYAREYTAFWKNMMKNTRLRNFHTLQEAKEITSTLQKEKSFVTFLQMIKHHTSPDLEQVDSWFNQSVSPEFTDINLLSRTSTRELMLSLAELEKYVTTLAVMGQAEKTAFQLARARFMSQNRTDPVSQLYEQSRLLPEPMASFAKQLADDTWSLLLSQARQHINTQWKETVYREYQLHIAGRYPLDAMREQEISLDDFNRFFSNQGALHVFIEEYVKPFLDTSTALWKPKNLNGFALPIREEVLQELIRANIISTMFFSPLETQAKINFSLQKISLDPVIASLQLDIGNVSLKDTHKTESFTQFTWPGNRVARLHLKAIDGNHYEIKEEGVWALFRLLEKVNVVVDNDDSTSLQIFFEVNSNSGRYLLKTMNPVNAFVPGVLNGFVLNEVLV